VKLSEWASVAEITGAIAVVASLMFVGVQVSQNTIAVRQGAQQAMVDYNREQSALLVTDATLREVVMRGEEDVASLTPDEHRQFYEFTTHQLTTWETSFINYKNGLVEEQMWAAWDGYFRLHTSGKDGYTTFWNDTRAQWDARFMDHIDAIGLSDQGESK
jgi:hypothetical protein